MMPLRVVNEPYVRSFQYKVLNSILYTNELLCKIGFISDPTVPSVIRLLRPYLIFSLAVLSLLPFGIRYVKKF